MTTKHEQSLPLILAALSDGSAQDSLKAHIDLINMAQAADKWDAHYNVRSISLVWSIEDVLGYAKEQGIALTDDEAMEILQAIERKHDASIGVSWSTIDEEINDFVTGSQRDLVWDVLSPDGISIHISDQYETQQDAQEAFKKWSKQYEKQGYYSSARYGRIDLQTLPVFCRFIKVDRIEADE